MYHSPRLQADYPLANHKEELLRMLWGMGSPPPDDEEQQEDQEMGQHGNGTSVTRSHLGDILDSLQMQHEGLRDLMNARFNALEDLSAERKRQVEDAVKDLKGSLQSEVGRNDRRFNLIAGSVVVAFLAEAARFIFR